MAEQAGAGMVERAVAQACAGERPLLASRSAVLVACSGGADSVALAAALAGLSRSLPALELRVTVGHVDHALRPESGREAEGVRALAAALGVPFLLERLGSLREAAAREGLEAAAREARYAALLRLARACGAQSVATAHTRSDQAETLLLRLARGAGPGALAGVRRARPLGELTLVRPLLDVPRAATEAYCAAHGLGFTRDPHNTDPRRSRAAVRAALPRLAALLNPRLEEALAGAAALQADEDALLAGLAQDALSAATLGAGYAVESLLRLHPALLRRALLVAAAAQGVRPERGHLVRLAGLLRKRAAKLDLPRGRAVVEGGALRFEAHAGRAGSFPPHVMPGRLALPGPGRYAWGTALIELGAGSEADLMEGAILVDAERAPLPWTARAPLPGDRFRPGAGHEKKLSDLLIDARIPRARRAGLVLLADADGALFFVEGLRPGAPVRGALASPVSLRVLRSERELPPRVGGFTDVQRDDAPRAKLPGRRPKGPSCAGRGGRRASRGGVDSAGDGPEPRGEGTDEEL